MQNVPPSSRRVSGAESGFTLVELLIAIAIAAILAAIAIPAYNDSVRKSRRAEAFAALTSVQQAQERWRGSNPAYTEELSDLGVSGTSPSGYYSITVEEPEEGSLNTGYVATATAVSGTSQANDTGCAKLSVRMDGGTLSYFGGAANAELDFSETSPCWAQ